MFSSCKALKTLSINAPLLEDCTDMVGHSADGVGTITSVHLNAPKLRKGSYAFYYCTSLTAFSGDLSSLIYGVGMFYGCKLDGTSVATIYNSIPTITLPKGYKNRDYMGVLSIGINSTYSSTASTNTTRLNNFGVAAGFADWASLKQAFVDKGWEVEWYYAASTKEIEV
jgi:hypothetical protein